VFASAASSQAALSIRLTDSVSTVTVVDGVDDLSADGNLIYTGTVGNWTINVSAATSNSPSSMPIMTMTTIGKSTLAASALTVEVSDKGFGGIDPNVFLTTLSTSTPGQGASHSTYLDDTDALFAQTTLLGATSATDDFDDDLSGAVATGNPYSLTMVVTIDPSVPSPSGLIVPITVIGTLQAVVPEATSVAVWGGLSLLGLVARRRRG
jgi:hypothetical protein